MSSRGETFLHRRENIAMSLRFKAQSSSHFAFSRELSNNEKSTKG
jgi:hypothetical protein